MANLLPPNATLLERNVAMVNSAISDIPTPLRDLMRPDSCPEALLPWLANTMSVDAWDAGWTDSQKRDSIRESMVVHQLKGTVAGVRRALSAIGVGVRVQEWFNQVPPGPPYTYRLLLDVGQTGISKKQMESVQSLVDATKNIRSHLAAVDLTVTSRAGPTVAAAIGVGNDIRITGTVPDLHLLMEGVAGGMAQTEAAVDALRLMLHTAMPSKNYW